MTQENQSAVPQDENQIIAERRAKLAEWRQAGNAFPNTFRREHVAADLHRQYDDLTKEQLEEAPVAVKVAGRMMLKRVMGKASFATIQDMSGRIQLYISTISPAQTCTRRSSTMTWATFSARRVRCSKPKLMNCRSVSRICNY